MKVTKTIKKIIKPFVDVPSWVGSPWIAEHWRLVSNSFRDLFSTREVIETSEDFSAAMARMNLTEKDINDRIKEFTLLFLFYFIFGIALVAYMVYLFSQHSFRGAILALSVVFFVLAQAFRCHFWMFQIKQRKLGCTFQEWLSGTFGGKK